MYGNDSFQILISGAYLPNSTWLFFRKIKVSRGAYWLGGRKSPRDILHLWLTQIWYWEYHRNVWVSYHKVVYFSSAFLFAATLSINGRNQVWLSSINCTTFRKSFQRFNNSIPAGANSKPIENQVLTTISIGFFRIYIPHFGINLGLNGKSRLICIFCITGTKQA